MFNLLKIILSKIKQKQCTGEHENQQNKVKVGYETFSQLSEKGDIDTIIFSKGSSIITLNDGRNYHFNALDKVSSMYSIPYSGTFESKETDFLRKFIKPGQICIDVGANFGWYTILFSKLVGETGSVHAFEPIPHTFEILERNVQLNKCLNVVINNVALDESKGQKDLFLPDIGVSGSFQLHKYDKDYQIIRSRTRTLDDYVEENGINCIDFIKADIEGAELLLLKGGRKTIIKNNPVLLLEIQNDSTKLFGYKPSDIFSYLDDLNYVPYTVSEKRGIVLLNDYSGVLPDYNFIFLPRNQHYYGNIL